MTHLLPPALFLSLACSGAMDQAQDRLEEEAAEAIAERLSGAENVELDASTGTLKMTIDGKTIEGDANGAVFSDGDNRITAGNKATVPADFPWATPASAEDVQAMVATLEGREVVTLTYRLAPTDLASVANDLESEIGTAGYTVQRRTADKHVSGIGVSSDKRKQVAYDLVEESTGIAVRLTRTGQP